VIPPLLQHQESALRWMDVHPKGWLALEQGLGKTRCVVEEDAGPTEVVVPAFLRANWAREIRRWRPGARVQFVTGHTGYPRGADYYIVAYNDLVNLVPPLGIERVVFDESHYMNSNMVKHVGKKRATFSKRTKHGCARIKTTRLVRLLSGTPDPNRPMELWAVANTLGMTRLTRNEWGVHFCNGHPGRWGGWDFTGASNVEELRRLFGEWSFRLTKREALTLPKCMRRLIVLGAKPDMRERSFEVNEIARNPNPVAFVGLSELLHEHGKRKTPEALEYIRGVMHDTRPVLIAAKHNAVVAMLRDGLKDAYRVATLTGETPTFKRDEIVQDFKLGRLDAVIGNSRAMGVGVDGLQERCHYLIVVETDWSQAVNAQLEGRLDRMGQTHRVQCDYLVCDRSIDARIIEKCLWKEDFAAQVTGDRFRQSIEDLF